MTDSMASSRGAIWIGKGRPGATRRRKAAGLHDSESAGPVPPRKEVLSARTVIALREVGASHMSFRRGDIRTLSLALIEVALPPGV